MLVHGEGCEGTASLVGCLKAQPVMSSRGHRGSEAKGQRIRYTMRETIVRSQATRLGSTKLNWLWVDRGRVRIREQWSGHLT